jgi:pilus assembly protein CpaE
MGYDTGRISLVLNRADTRVGITHEDVEAIIGRAPDVLVPSDRQIPISVNDGIPIVARDERSDPARAFRKLAEKYAESREEAAPHVEAPMEIKAGKRRFAWRS